MKKLIISLLIVHLGACADSTFKFVNNKTEGSLDKFFIQKLVETFNLDFFFETGTYNAGTTINAAPYFKKVHTVELHKGLFKSAKNRLTPYHNVTIYNDSSPKAIKKVTPHLSGTILFWLDAHFSGKGTALSFDDPNAPEAITAIREELAAIKNYCATDCVILIDDIRGFGTKIYDTEYLGCWAYPTLQEVKQDLLKINSNFELALLGDTLLAYDKYKYHPSISETVKACTTTRLYNGYNLTDQELMNLEEQIMKAPLEEKEYIKHLYNIMTEYQDPMFWHDLWYGLVNLESKHYTQAKEALLKLRKRKTPYRHWRIHKYIGLCDFTK